MTSKKIAAITLIAGSTLIGCASGPGFAPATSIPKGESLVYVYMKNGIFGSALLYNIYADHKLITALHNGAYYPIYAPGGRITLGAKERPTVGIVIEALVLAREHDSPEFHFAPGTVHYVTFTGSPNLRFDRDLCEVDREKGEREIANCRKADPVTE